MAKGSLSLRTITNIDKSLNITPDIPKKRIVELYREAEIELPDAVVRRLSEVEEFNKKILDNRSKRLIKEKMTLRND